MQIKSLLSKLIFFMTGIVVACTLLFTSNYAFSQEKENKKEIINPKREVFVVPAVTPNNNADASKTKPKVKSMSPELLDDPWEEKLEKRDSIIEAESKLKNQEENKAQEMKTDTKIEDNKETIIKDNTLKEENPKNNKTDNPTKKN